MGRASHALVLFMHGGLWAGGVGLWAVVVVVVGVVSVAFVVLVGLVVVVGLVMVVVLWVRPQDPLAFQWGGGRASFAALGGCTAWWIVGAGLGPGLAVTAFEGSHVPGSVWPAVMSVFGGWMMGRLEMRMWMRVCTGSCCVAASLVAVRVGGRGAQDAVGAGLWLGFGLGFELGRGRFWCCCHRAFCHFLGCVWWCGWCL